MAAACIAQSLPTTKTELVSNKFPERVLNCAVSFLTAVVCGLGESEAPGLAR